MSNRYYDTQMLALAHPAQYKNELQAAGDGFMNMYSNYLKNRLNKNEVLTSDLGLEFMNATQDDRIKQAKLDTNIKQNQADLNALELNTAKQIQKDTIEQTRLKTLSDSEKLKQEQFTTKTQPEIFNMQKSLNNAQINNLNSSIAERNFSMFLKKHAFNENERATNSSTLFQNFLNDNNLQGDDNAKFAYVKHLDDEYNYALNNPLLNDSQRAKRLSEIQKIKLEFAEYLPQIAKANSIVTQGFNSFSSKGGNGGDGDIKVANILNNLNISKELDKKNTINNNAILELEKEKNAIKNNYTLNDTEKAEKIQKINDNINTIKKENNEIENYKQQNLNVNFSDIYNIMQVKTNSQIAKDDYQNLQHYKNIKDLLNQAANLTDEVGYYGINNKIFGVAADLSGSTLEMRKLEKVMQQLISEFSGEKGKTLSKEYDNLRRLVPDVNSFANNIKKVRQALSSIDNYVLMKANNISSSYGEDVKALVNKIAFNNTVDDIFNNKDSELNLVLNSLGDYSKDNPRIKILPSGQKMYLQSNGAWSVDKPYGFRE